MRMSGVLKVVIATCAIFLIAAHLSPATAAPATQLVTCVDLASGKERISRTDTCRTTEATAQWHLAPTDSALGSGSTTKTLVLCSYKESPIFSYRQSRLTCPNRYRSTLYSRSTALPAKPVITQVSSTSYESASLALASDPAANLDAPIAYYTITSSKGDVKKVNSWRELTVTVSGLKSSTSYTFTITATSVDGTSPVSASSLPVTTQVYVAPVAAVTSTPLAAPAFTLSASAETRTVGTAATGFTISSTGGTIASFGISATPAGMSFSTSTGVLTGTPTATQSATTYSITATNASGSATKTFTLTVSVAVYTVGNAGPGGGTIFYVAGSPFACGPTRTGTCTYLEAAPSNWNPAGDPTKLWSVVAQDSNDIAAIANENNTTNPYNYPLAIGLGYLNSVAIVLQGNDTTTAAGAARAYTGGSKNDWYLPTTTELNQLCQWARGVAPDITTPCSGGSLGSTTYGAGSAGLGANYYWSSSENSSTFAHIQGFANGNQTNAPKSTAGAFYVRPIRAF